MQRITLELPIGSSEKCGSKAMKVAVSIPGVTSVNIDREWNQLVVIGCGVDSVGLANSLRKKFSYANIVAVESVPAGDHHEYTSEDQAEDQAAAVQCQAQPYNYHTTLNHYPQYPPPYYLYHNNVYDTNPSNCSIL